MASTFSTAGIPDRRFLRHVLDLALDEVRRAHKDYLGIPHLFLALTRLDRGCTCDVLHRMGFSPEYVRDQLRFSLGSGYASDDMPILPTRRCREILQIAERNTIDANQPFIDERSIARALLSERSGVLYELLTRLGIDTAHLIEQMLISDVHAVLELASESTSSTDASSVAMIEGVLPIPSAHEEIGLKEHQQQLTFALAQVTLPAGVAIRVWTVADFPAIQRISSSEGWPSPVQRSAEALLAWQRSWPALVAIADEDIVGFVRALTDGAITMYIAEIAVDARLRRHGIGRALLDTCHYLYPTVRLDLLTVDDVRAFYEACGFRMVYNGMRKSYR